MKIKLKKIRHQVIVITGASSGIGLATARMAAQKGAKLVLAARSDGALRTLTDEINEKGVQAIYVEADVGNPQDVRKIARAAIERYGGFDTWVNNAGIGMYGKLEEADIEAMRKLFETNFWGLLYGSLEAVEHLKQRGGALINVGSTESERGVPLQGAYAASKHAVKGFTDVLRMELDADGAPVSVTLIKPAAVDTPFPLNAKNYLASEPQHVAPVYAPEAVAEAILHCSETPVRELFVGAGGKGYAAMGYYAPSLADKIGEQYVMAGTESGKPRRERDALDQPSEKLQERGDYPAHVAQSSLYTKTSLHPWLTGAAALGAGWLLRAWWRTIRSPQEGDGLHWANPYEGDVRSLDKTAEAAKREIHANRSECGAIGRADL
jgi:short-subunit dehydrogenase